MEIKDYLIQRRIKRLRKRSDLEKYRAEVAASLGSNLKRIEEIRREQAEWIGISPEAFDALLLRFSNSRDLGSVYAELSRAKELPTELRNLILDLRTLLPAEGQLRLDSVDRKVHELPPILLDALLRDAYNRRVFERTSSEFLAPSIQRNFALIPGAALFLVLLLAAVGLFFVRRDSNPSQPPQRSEQPEMSSGLGGVVTLPSDDEESLAIARALDEAHSELRSALWLHFFGAVLLLAGLGVTATAKRYPKLQIAGAALSLLGGLSLFPIKEFHVFGNLADKIEVRLPPRNRTTNTAIAGFEMEQACIVETFPEAMADVDDPGVRPSLQKCSDVIAKRSAAGWSIAFMFLVGHADKRNLRPSQRPKLANNEALAFRRASATKAYFLKTLGSFDPQLDERIIVTSAGAANIGVNTTGSDLAKDRSVNVYAYWIFRRSMRQASASNR